MTRAPERFSLLAGVPAAVLAAAGLRDLLARLPGRAWRAAAFSGLAAVAVADLTMVGYPRGPLPELPGCYRFLKLRDPKATLLEIPYTPGSVTCLSGECTYWQSIHRLNTSAGYSSQANALQARQIGPSCPLHMALLAKPDYLKDPAKVDINILTDVDFKDYLWLYLTVNRFDYVVLHRWVAGTPQYKVSVQRFAALLQDCKIYEDEATIVYARSRLTPPARPVQIARAGWKEWNIWQGQGNWLLGESGHVAIYNPQPECAITLALNVASLRQPRSVRIRTGAGEVARWEITPDVYQTVSSPPLRLPAGLQELTIEDVTPDVDPNDNKPLLKDKKGSNHLRIAGLKIVPTSNPVWNRQVSIGSISGAADP